MKIFLLLQLLACNSVVLGGSLLANEYHEGETLPIYVSQVESLKINVPYNFYDVGNCRPEYHENLYTMKRNKNWGEALAGELWNYSPYEVTIRTKKDGDFDPSKF